MMNSQIGVYADSYDHLEQWAGLISLADPIGPRDLLAQLGPFLRQFHCDKGMEDAGGLTAWIAWKMVQDQADPEPSFEGVTVDRELRVDIEYFYRITPGQVEVFRIDEVLEWHPIAQLEITCEAADEADESVETDIEIGRRDF